MIMAFKKWITFLLITNQQKSYPGELEGGLALQSGNAGDSATKRWFVSDIDLFRPDVVKTENYTCQNLC